MVHVGLDRYIGDTVQQPVVEQSGIGDVHKSVVVDIAKNQLDIQTGTLGALANIAVGGLGAAGGIANSIQSIGSMAFDAVRYKYPTVSGGGVNGSFLGMHSTSYLQARFYTVVNQNNSELGRPLYQTKTLSSLSGFCVCSGAEAATPAMSEENDLINNYLNTGFYIE